MLLDNIAPTLRNSDDQELQIQDRARTALLDPVNVFDQITLPQEKH